MATTIAAAPAGTPDLTRAPSPFTPTPAQIAKVTRLLDAESLDECWAILLASKPASRCACDRNSPCRYPLCPAGDSS